MYDGHIPQNQIAVIHPDISLKDKWINILEERYKNDQTDKNKRALDFAEAYFENSINDLLEDKWLTHIIIDKVPEDGDYDLNKYINDSISYNNGECFNNIWRVK